MTADEAIRPTSIGTFRAPLATMSIRSKLSIVISFGFLLAFAVSISMVTLNTRATGLKFLEAREWLIADLLSDQVQAATLFRDKEGIAAIFEPATDYDESLIWLEIVHASGEQLSQYGRTAYTPEDLQPTLAEVIATGEKIKITEGSYLTAIVPIFAEDGVNVLGAAAFVWTKQLFLQNLHDDILWVVLLSGFVALIGLIVIMMMISRLVTRPIQELSNAMQRVSNNELRTKIPNLDRRDEIGVMASNLETFRDALAKEDTQNKLRQQENGLRQSLFRELANHMSKLAAGRTDCVMDERAFAELDRDHQEICRNFNNVLQNLRCMLSTIISTAESVRTSALEISDVADDQSRRSEAQAATLEESAAAIEELSTSVQKTADLAASANELIADNKKLAAAGGDVVGKTVDAMRDIEESSQQITAIIDVIDDIAFQTNLLALNAGVEAARAGESGRGFAVVASEVRALAQRAADSANEIRELILRSSGHVAEGSELATQAGAALNDIIQGVNHVSELVSDIATGSSEQAQNLTEIKESVLELDKVTQQNAAVIEESSAASRSLSNEARRMTDALRQFDVNTSDKDGDAARSRTKGKLGDWKDELADQASMMPRGSASSLVPGRRARSSQAVPAEQEWDEF